MSRADHQRLATLLQPRWLSAALDGSRAPFLTREMTFSGTRQGYLIRTLLPSHGGNTGSNPVCAANLFEPKCRGFVRSKAVAKSPLQPATLLQPKWAACKRRLKRRTLLA